MRLGGGEEADKKKPEQQEHPEDCEANASKPACIHCKAAYGRDEAQREEDDRLWRSIPGGLLRYDFVRFIKFEL